MIFESDNCKFATEINGQPERPVRWKECLGKVTSALGISVSALYVRKYFNKEAKEAAVEMVANIEREFQKNLRTVR